MVTLFLQGEKIFNKIYRKFQFSMIKELKSLKRQTRDMPARIRRL